MHEYQASLTRLRCVAFPSQILHSQLKTFLFLFYLKMFGFSVPEETWGWKSCGENCNADDFRLVWHIQSNPSANDGFSLLQSLLDCLSDRNQWVMENSANLNMFWASVLPWGAPQAIEWTCYGRNIANMNDFLPKFDTQRAERQLEKYH